jgi:hypothetical protein
LPLFLGSTVLLEGTFVNRKARRRSGRDPRERRRDLRGSAPGFLRRLQAIDDQMPLILTPEQFDAWLDPENPDPQDVLASGPDEELELVPVSDWVNNARHEGPQCLAPANP